MANEQHIKSFTAADIERYHKGLLSAKERHALEKAALEDPFLADALEGYAFAGQTLPHDLTDLKNRIAARTEAAKIVPIRGAGNRFSPMLRVAAMVILLAGAGLLVYQFAFNKKDQDIAQAKPETTQVKDNPDLKKDSGSATTSNKTVIAETTKATVPPAAKNDNSVVTEKNGPVISGGQPVKNLPPVQKEAESAENKPVTVKGELSSPSGSGAVTVTPKPAPADKDAGQDLTKLKEKETAREESKTRSVAAKKQDEDIDALKKKQTRQADDERKNLKQVTASQQPVKDYYNAQAMNTFRGRVTDPNNVGLPFANVTNVRDNVGTYTDANGNFVLTSTDSVLSVQVRSVGYEYNNVQLRNNLPANRVVMQEDRQVLSEVVTTTRKPNTAARANDNNRTLIEPEPVDGWANYDSYLENNLNLPEEYRQQKNTEVSSVELSFEVDKNGEPVNIRVEKSLCNSCDKEAIRLVKEGPKWKRNAGKKGRTRVTINF